MEVTLSDVTRETVLMDVYAGLRSSGYTLLAAIRALRVLGCTLGEAKAVSDRVEIANGRVPFGGFTREVL